MAERENAPLSLRTFVRPAVILILFFCAILVVRRIPLTVEIVVVAAILSFGLNPIISLVSRRMPRSASIAVVFVALIVVILASLIIVIPSIVEQVQTLVSNSGTYFTTAKSWVANEESSINHRFGGHLLPSQTTKASDQLFGDASKFVQNSLGSISVAVISTVNALVVIFSAIVLSCYFLANADTLQKSFLSFFPKRAQADALRFAGEIERIFGGYISGQLILSAFCAVATFLILALIHAKFALLVGMLTGLLYSIPYIGEPAAMLLGVFFGFTQSWQIAIASAIVILAVTRISDTFFVPKVMSKTVGISPMGIMLAVFAGGELAGLWGLLLAIPAAALIKIVWQVWLQPWLTNPTQPTSQTTTG